MSKPRLALIGCGYWGQNLLRNFVELREVEVKTVCDFDLGALARLKRRYPLIDLEPDYRAVLSDARIDAVVIATPASTHYPIARKALLAGKHVLVETPMATAGAEAFELVELAQKRARMLMVDHTFLYTSAVRTLKSLVERELGDMLYFDSARISLGLVRSDLNVLWDLGAHDFSILNHLSGRDPVAVTATGTRHFGCSFENIAYVSAEFNGNLSAHFHLNWLSPVKMRRTLIGGSRKMIIYDDLEASEKLKVYGKSPVLEHGTSVRETLLTGFQNGDMVAPVLETREALAGVAEDFAHAMIDKRPPLADGYFGYRVVRLLEAAQRSMTQHGRPVELSPAAAPRIKTGKAVAISQ
ncbi:MAG TPA: Gfo/Idh/MocA family oxidoreductase [Bryobacteraceae bacterium]|jgi:predicted dehydrogenase|nr:Gfo/Idh/MocA family oxidoreductase [Bryobacteraceae bacterium]